jgi:hypothetical protein
MPRKVPHSEDPAGTAGRTRPPAPLRSSASGTSISRPLPLDRLADLVVDGAVDLPSVLSDEEREQVVRSVRQRLRHRILGHVAHLVALDLWRETRSKE